MESDGPPTLQPLIPLSSRLSEVCLSQGALRSLGKLGHAMSWTPVEARWPSRLRGGTDTPSRSTPYPSAASSSSSLAQPSSRWTSSSAQVFGETRVYKPSHPTFWGGVCPAVGADAWFYLVRWIRRGGGSTARSSLIAGVPAAHVFERGLAFPFEVCARPVSCVCWRMRGPLGRMGLHTCMCCSLHPWVLSRARLVVTLCEGRAVRYMGESLLFPVIGKHQGQPPRHPAAQKGKMDHGICPECRGRSLTEFGTQMPGSGPQMLGQNDTVRAT